jgi:nicotinamide-nucleotide amidase
MARPLRIELPGAYYHVTTRGNARGPIFLDESERELFLELLASVVERFAFICHAFCLMGNHYHLLIETQRANLADGLRQLNGVYSQTVNRRRGRSGHLFGGRYKAILVEKEPHLAALCRYIVRNPVRARLCDSPADWRWSSYGATAGERPAPSFLRVDEILAQFGRRREEAQRRYRAFVGAGDEDDPFEGLHGQIYLGSEEFAHAHADGAPPLAEVPRGQWQPVRPGLADILSAEGEQGILVANRRYGYRLREIADHLGCHLSTVSRRVSRLDVENAQIQDLTPGVEEPRAVVVVTGSELVRGGRRDLNGPFLARELLDLGVEPARIVIVGDRPEELEGAVAEALEKDIAVFSGGLGPTHDDRTVEMIARIAGRPLVVDEELEREIEAVSRGVAERLGRPYHDFAAGVTKQASIPEGAVALGLAGTAPAVLLEHDRGVAIALPGPPGELRRLWPSARAHEAFRRVVERARPREHRVLRFFGPSESAVARVLDEAGGDGGGVEVTVCARDLELHVDLFFDRGGATRAAALEETLRDAFRAQLFAQDERSVEELVLALCREQGLTLATAESCTGGLVGTRLTAIAGASDVFLGGVIAYANDVKLTSLGVGTDVLEEHGAVSAETAAAMSDGVRSALGADVAIAVTGVAGPGGGTPEKPVGLVYLHARSPQGERAQGLQLPGDRGAIRARATVAALHLLRRLLSHSDTNADGLTR